MTRDIVREFQATCSLSLSNPSQLRCDTRFSSQKINDIVRQMFIRTEARTERALSISK